ncbi:MAG TPA: polyprenol monophosphomannose synthase [Nitrospinota bacterium]|jgi:dolichol-phosphate mannosyltransferase|nr:polyprenol monophosphomannose synthase [Nitrospinota bacterium]
MKTTVMIPTYNERENIKSLINDILSLDNDISVVVVDDNSPDGTSQLVESSFSNNSRVDLICRKDDKGRGTAGIVGFQHALKKGADYIVEMDSDYSHHPKYIPTFLKEIQNFDVVIGSRNIEGGKEAGRSVFREFITWFANVYIRIIMGINIKDCTSGYRCFRRQVLESIGLEKMVSKGPSIVEEILYACHLKKFRIKEIPILFEDRTRGDSTKNLCQYIDTAWKTLQFRFKM